jgi:flagellar L-ring protein precursor FlgH
MWQSNAAEEETMKNEDQRVEVESALGDLRHPVAAEGTCSCSAIDLTARKARAASGEKKERPRRRRAASMARRIIMGMSLAIGLALLFSTPVFSVSLWNPGAGSLYQAPPRVFRNGDIITILVNEATSADAQWKAEREKEVKIEGTASNPGLGAGTKNLLGRFFPFMGAGYQSENKTENQSDRRTSIRATIAAEVVNVLPNGHLQIVARKVIRVNAEEQLIELSGNVRAEDVSENFIVSSAQIADANIKVNGTLRYTNDQRPSPLERVFSFISGIFL